MSYRYCLTYLCYVFYNGKREHLTGNNRNANFQIQKICEVRKERWNQ